jgi:UDP-GlcNAc:undecaprenyl-phosphate GlcNAc-1-phosphate transferase
MMLQGLARTDVILLLALGFVLSVVTNVLLLRKFKAYKRTPNPGQIRWASQQKPAVGGISFAVALVLGMAFGWGLDSIWAPLQWTGLAAGAVLAFGVGLLDDFKHVSALRRLLVQLACAGLVVGVGLGVQCTGWAAVDGLITVFWVVGLMNAVNMLDNMDGITTITSIFSALFVVLAAALHLGRLGTEAAVFLALIAGLFGFLVVNWHPSKIYMGDGGSMLLGFLLAIGSIAFCWNLGAITGSFRGTDLLVALLVMALPLTDTAVVIINRLSHGVSPATGGRDHTTHNLSYLGMADNYVAVTYSFLSMINLCWALWIAYGEPEQFVIFTATAWGLGVFCVFFLISRYNLRRGKYTYNV